MDKLKQTEHNSSFSVLRRNIGMAIVASCAITIPSYLLLSAEAIEDERTAFPEWADLFLLSASPIAYILAGIMFWLWRNTILGRKIPHWINVALFGSLLLNVLIHVFFGLLGDNKPSFPPIEALLRTVLFTLGFGAYTAVFTGLVYYLPSISKVLKR